MLTVLQDLDQMTWKSLHLFSCKPLYRHRKRAWLSNYDADILFYRRYVDDTFCLFNTEADANNLFYDFINTRHPNIKLYDGKRSWS